MHDLLSLRSVPQQTLSFSILRQALTGVLGFCCQRPELLDMAPNSRTHTWQGIIFPYEFSVHSLSEMRWLPSCGGTYIFAECVGPFDWKAHYVGKATDLNDRISFHEKLQAATLAGATHIHLRAASSDFQRSRDEADLIRKHRPILNKDIPEFPLTRQEQKAIVNFLAQFYRPRAAAAR